MAHFAELDKTNTVTKIRTLNNSVMTDSDGVEQEEMGISAVTKHNGGCGWFVQTSYNNNFRKQYAGKGYTYDKANDVFITPQPFPSWSLDAAFDWQSPTAMPEDGKMYTWNESTKAWDEV